MSQIAVFNDVHVRLCTNSIVANNPIVTIVANANSDYKEHNEFDEHNVTVRLRLELEKHLMLAEKEIVSYI